MPVQIRAGADPVKSRSRSPVPRASANLVTHKSVIRDSVIHNPVIRKSVILKSCHSERSEESRSSQLPAPADSSLRSE